MTGNRDVVEFPPPSLSLSSLSKLLSLSPPPLSISPSSISTPLSNSPPLFISPYSLYLPLFSLSPLLSLFPPSSLSLPLLSIFSSFLSRPLSSPPLLFLSKLLSLSSLPSISPHPLYKSPSSLYPPSSLWSPFLSLSSPFIYIFLISFSPSLLAPSFSLSANSSWVSFFMRIHLVFFNSNSEYRTNTPRFRRHVTKFRISLDLASYILYAARGPSPMPFSGNLMTRRLD